MKVTFFTPSGSDHGGIAQCSDFLKVALNKKGKSVKFVKNNNFSSSNPFYFLKRAIRCMNSDVLFVQYNTNLFGKFFGLNGVFAYLFYFIVFLARCKIVTTIHDIPELEKYATYKKLVLKFLFFPILFFSNVITVHNPIAKKLILEYGCKESKIKLLELGIDLDIKTFSNSKKAKKELGFSDKKLLLLWGYIRPSKGCDIAINAMKHVPEDVSLVVIGPTWSQDKSNSVSKDQTYFDDLKELVKNLKLSSRVFVEGKMLDDDEVAKYMSAADVVLLPYRFITQSAVLVRCLAFRKKVLTSNIPPFQDVKNKYHATETFKINSGEDFAKKVDLLLNDSKKISDLEKNIEAVRKALDWNNIAAELWKIFISAFK